MGPPSFEDPGALPGPLSRATDAEALVCALAFVGVGLATEPFLGWFAEATLLS